MSEIAELKQRAENLQKQVDHLLSQDHTVQTKRCYVSGPMSMFALERWNFPAFDAAKRELQRRLPEWVFVTPADMDRVFDGFDGTGPTRPDVSRAYCLRRDTSVITYCSAIYMLRSWSHSQGCWAEICTAMACGCEVWYETGAEFLHEVAPAVAEVFDVQ